MPDNSLLLMFANKNHPANADAYYPYVRNSYFYYLTGITEPDTALIIHRDSKGKYEELLLIPEIPEWRKVWDGEVLDKQSAREISGAKNIEYLPSLVPVLRDLVNPNTQLFYPGRLKRSETVLFPEQRAKSIFRRYFPSNRQKSVIETLNKLRLVKGEEEISMIREAIKLTGEGLELMKSRINSGKVEYELETDLLGYFRRKRSRGFAFDPIIASGANSCTLHYIQNDSKLKTGDVLLTDVGAEFGGYNADITRVYPVGKWSQRNKRVFDAVYRVITSSVKLYKPGTTIEEINREVGELVEGELLQLALINSGEISSQNENKPAYRKYFMHSAAHFLGLDVHDVGDKKTVLKPGMVLTLEPGIYIPEWQVGVRLEDDILITKDGCEVLSRGIPY